MTVDSANGVTQVVCRQCRRPMKFIGERQGFAHFERCARHPNNKRPGRRYGEPSFTVPHRASAVGTVGINVDVLRAPRHGPLAV